MDFSGLGGLRYIEALMQKLGLDAGERERFCLALQRGDAGRSAVVLTRRAPEGWTPPFAPEPGPLVSWLPEGVFPVESEDRAGKLEGFAEGWFYPLDLSSVWEVAALSAWEAPVRRFLDMCSAPGGKTFLCARRLKVPEHFANEVEGGRLGILLHNLRRCGMTSGVYTQRMHPRVWAEMAPGAFDGVWADAPCSGQSLLAKGVKNPGCFHPSLVKGNAKRQRGVLAGCAACVAPGGFLGYSTCSFSLEENEMLVAWFLKNFPEFSSVEVPLLSPWRSVISAEYCYRLMPQHGLGAGGFVTLFKRAGERPEQLPGLPADMTLFPVQ